MGCTANRLLRTARPSRPAGSRVWVMLNEPAVTFYESQDFALHVHDADGTRGGSSTAEAVAACCRSP